MDTNTGSPQGCTIIPLPKPSNFVSDRRVGKFRIPDRLITGYPEMLLALMSNMLVMRAEHCFVDCRLHVTAYSPAFDAVDLAFEPCPYNLIEKVTSNGRLVELGIERSTNHSQFIDSPRILVVADPDQPADEG